MVLAASGVLPGLQDTAAGPAGVPPLAGGDGAEFGSKPLRAAVWPPGLTCWWTSEIKLRNSGEIWLLQEKCHTYAKVPTVTRLQGNANRNHTETPPSVHQDGQNQTAKSAGWRGGGEVRASRGAGGDTRHEEKQPNTGAPHDPAAPPPETPAGDREPARTQECGGPVAPGSPGGADPPRAAADGQARRPHAL